MEKIYLKKQKVKNKKKQNRYLRHFLLAMDLIVRPQMFYDMFCIFCQHATFKG